jgi:hypothetical protein
MVLPQELPSAQPGTRVEPEFEGRMFWKVPMEALSDPTSMNAPVPFWLNSILSQSLDFV